MQGAAPVSPQWCLSG